MDARDQEKKERLLGALEKGMVMIHLDARRPGVSVPEHLRAEAHLRLNLSYRFDPPDLSVTAWGVRSTLSFSGKRFTVAIPWSALFAVTSYVTREFWMYPDDMPQELLQAAMVKERPGVGTAASLEAASEPPAETPPPPRRVALQEVKGGLDDEDLRSVERSPSEGLAQASLAAEQSPSPEEAAKRRGHLRLVK